MNYLKTQLLSFENHWDNPKIDLVDPHRTKRTFMQWIIIRVARKTMVVNQGHTKYTLGRFNFRTGRFSVRNFVFAFARPSGRSGVK